MKMSVFADNGKHFTVHNMEYRSFQLWCGNHGRIQTNIMWEDFKIQQAHI